MKDALLAVVQSLVAEGAATAASAVVAEPKGQLAAALAGWRDEVGGEGLRRHHRFDLASLTKPWTATLALTLAERGLVPLDLAIGEVWPHAAPVLARQPLQDLLRHHSGLLAWRPLYRQARSRDGALARILRADSLGAPKPTYSDLGFILWLRAAEQLTGATGEELLSRYVLRPLRLSTVEVSAGPGVAVRTLLGNEREVELAAGLGVKVGLLKGGPPQGVVQDGNARFLGGLAGHAGLFAPASALARLGREWLAPSAVLSPASVEQALAGTGRYRLGWWARACAPAATRGLSVGAYGHHGFTGGSLWIDRTRRRVVVLLCHRSGADRDLDPWRRRVHRIAMS